MKEHDRSSYELLSWAEHLFARLTYLNCKACQRLGKEGSTCRNYDAKTGFVEFRRRPKPTVFLKLQTCMSKIDSEFRDLVEIQIFWARSEKLNQPKHCNFDLKNLSVFLKTGAYRILKSPQSGVRNKDWVIPVFIRNLPGNWMDCKNSACVQKIWMFAEATRSPIFLRENEVLRLRDPNTMAQSSNFSECFLRPMDRISRFSWAKPFIFDYESMSTVLVHLVHWLAYCHGRAEQHRPALKG